MNNYCRNCGEKLENGIKICPKCNTEVLENRVNVEVKEKEVVEYKNKENICILLTLALYSLCFFVYKLSDKTDFENLTFICSLLFWAATVTLIYIRITMNDSKKIKLMFNIIVGIIVALFLFFSIVVYALIDFLRLVCS